MLIGDDELNLRLCLRIELQKFAIVFAVRRNVHKGEMCPLYCTQQTQGCLSSFRVKVIWTTSTLVEVLSATSTPIEAPPSATSFSKSSSIPSATSTLKQPPQSPSKLPPSSLLLHRHPHIQHQHHLPTTPIIRQHPAQLTSLRTPERTQFPNSKPP
jgi:hypothetical protein